MKIGLIHEGKQPTDRRVALPPAACKEVVERYPQVQIIVQSSDVRCFVDEDYASAGFEVRQDISDCDVLIGIKEVPINRLIPNKIYFFFSHTTKEQPYNRELLRSLLKLHIRMIDYEHLTDQNDRRIIAFGRFAGLVGAYNGLLTYGQKHGLFSLKRAHDCFDLKEMFAQCAKVKLPPIKIALTGGGRVAGGAVETLRAAGIRQVTCRNFVDQQYHEPVFARFKSIDYHYRLDGQPFQLQDFYNDPAAHGSRFWEIAQQAELLIAGAYWHPKAPVLFTPAQMADPAFRINTIADITCDIEGSIPSTKRPSTIEDPVYDYDPKTQTEQPAFSSPAHISVMAVDNLPNELPRDASQAFGRMFVDQVLPDLLYGDPHAKLARATITEEGKLTDAYAYLQGFVNG